MHIEILSPAQVRVLDGLTALPAVGEFYLAGGTALALRHGHRRSIDFDFFRKDPFEAEPLQSSLDAAFSPFELLPSGPHTLHVRLLGVSASFFRLPYPLLAPPEMTPWGFGLASDDRYSLGTKWLYRRGIRTQ